MARVCAKKIRLPYADSNVSNVLLKPSLLHNVALQETYLLRMKLLLLFLWNLGYTWFSQGISVSVSLSPF